MESLQKEWDSCITVIPTENGPVYICSENVPQTRSEISLSTEKGGLSKIFMSKLSFGLTPCNPGDSEHANVMYNSFAYKKLEAELTENCKQFGSKVACFSFFPGELNSIEKGFLIRSSDETSGTIRSFVASIAKKYGQSGYFEYEVEGDRVKQKLIDFTDQDSYDGQLICSSTLVQVMPPDCHPLFVYNSLLPVYQDKTVVHKALSEVY